MVGVAILFVFADSGYAKAEPVKLQQVARTEGLAYPESVAVAPNGNLYVAERGRNRIQELTPTGQFVLTFGKEVNETEDKTAGATEAEKDVCTAASGNVCKAGVEGTGTGAFAEAQSLAFDDHSEHLYVQDLTNWRVDEYTSTGEFVAMFGREVNETEDNTPGASEAEKNVCTAASVCKAGIEGTAGAAEPGVFNFEQFAGDLLAFGGPGEGLLYVGDEHRVQELEGDGQWKQLPLSDISSAPESSVVALAVDAAGDLYVVYRVDGIANVIHVFDSSGLETKAFDLPAGVQIGGIALDGTGHLAVSAREAGRGAVGMLLDASSGELITEFQVSASSDGISFGPTGDLYLVNNSEVVTYEPFPVAELVATAAACAAGVEVETFATFDCKLEGTTNPETISETEAWFQWGRTAALGHETPRQSIPTGSTPVPVEARIEGLRPHETAYFHLAGNDHNAKPPELLTSQTISFTTPSVPPQVTGQPSTSFVKSSSAVLSGELNPENATTAYAFEYGRCEDLEGCAEVAETAALASAEYGPVGVSLEASGLHPDTTYYYRLVAVNEQGEAGECHEGGGGQSGCEGSFRTGAAPVPTATTGGVSGIGETFAEVTGTVDPDGQPATFTFELGLYAGPATRYGVVFSGGTGIETGAVPESLELTGLQPGTEYAYRITVTSGYGSASGEAVRFATAPAPGALSVPAVPQMLAIPNGFSFPKPALTKPALKCKRGYTRDKQGKCVKSKKSTKPRKHTKPSGKGRHRTAK